MRGVTRSYCMHAMELAQQKKYIHVATLASAQRLMYTLGFASPGLAPTYIKVAWGLL